MEMGNTVIPSVQTIPSAMEGGLIIEVASLRDNLVVFYYVSAFEI